MIMRISTLPKTCILFCQVIASCRDIVIFSNSLSKVELKKLTEKKFSYGEYEGCKTVHISCPGTSEAYIITNDLSKSASKEEFDSARVGFDSYILNKADLHSSRI